MATSRLMAILVLVCYCEIHASRDQNVWILKFLPQGAVDEDRYQTGLTTYKATMNLTSSLHETDTRYLGIALASKHIDHPWISSPSLVNIAGALSPCDIRVGGTSADFLIFKPSGSACQTEEQSKFSEDIYQYDSGHFKLGDSIANFTITGAQWEVFNTFIANAKLDLLFDANLFWWRSDGLWDSSNFELLLNYSAVRNIPIPYFQLGNEPNAFWGNFGIRVEPSTLLKDFQILKDVISKYPLYAKSKLYGPDVTNVGKTGSARVYFKAFVAAGAYNVVDQYSLHQYYLDGSTATAMDFLSVDVLDSFKVVLQEATYFATTSPQPLPIMFTETASCYGGGATGLSDSYIAGFMWLDKLGLAAQYGVTKVFRQTLFGGAYGLITSGLQPLPDYYLSVLYKRLIEGPVFNITIQPANSTLRVYAHCARRGLYSPGALAVYYLNLGDSPAAISLDQFKTADLDLYLLTPGDANGLTSKSVKLNDQVLQMSGNNLPPMPPKPYKGEVTVAAQTFGFIVVPQAQVTLCIDYYDELDSLEMK